MPANPKLCCKKKKNCLRITLRKSKELIDTLKNIKK